MDRNILYYIFWGHNNRYLTIFVYKQLGKENNSGAAYTVYV